MLIPMLKAVKKMLEEPVDANDEVSITKWGARVVCAKEIVEELISHLEEEGGFSNRVWVTKNAPSVEEKSDVDVEAEQAKEELM